jgi:hypothetical protein
VVGLVDETFMSSEDLKQLATLIAQGQFLQNWQLYVTSGLLLFLTTSIAAFFGAYFKTRGEINARQTDIDKIVGELKKTTTVVESVKKEILFADWHNREVTQVKRRKLEELFEIAAGFDEWIQGIRQYYWFDGNEEPSQLALHRLELTQRLYFPELRDCTDSLLNSLQEIRINGLGVMQDRLRRAAPSLDVKGIAPTDAQNSAMLSGYKAYLYARKSFEITVVEAMSVILASREKVNS